MREDSLEDETDEMYSLSRTLIGKINLRMIITIIIMMSPILSLMHKRKS
jgi:hypothetical protein